MNKCPICNRTNVKLVPHHDHIDKFIKSEAKRLSGHENLQNSEPEKWELVASLIKEHSRFDPVEICNECNTKEGSFKKSVKGIAIDLHFSFSKEELMKIVFINPSEPNRIRSRKGMAGEIYSRLLNYHQRRKAAIAEALTKIVGGP